MEQQREKEQKEREQTKKWTSGAENATGAANFEFSRQSFSGWQGSNKSSNGELGSYGKTLVFRKAEKPEIIEQNERVVQDS